MSDKTKTWLRLEAGKKYNLNMDPPYYDLVDTNWEMFKGNQYVNSNTSDNLPRPVFNIIKRIITFFIASLTSSPSKVSFDQISTGVLDETDMEILNQEFDNFAERVKLQSIIRDSYKDAAITGDYVWHLWYDPDKDTYQNKLGGDGGEICMELVDSVNLYLSNSNDRNIDNQSWVIITGRSLISDLQEEYNQYQKDKMELEGDNDTEYQAGLDSRLEIDDTDGTGKATYAVMYEKKKTKEGTKVFVSKSLQDITIYENIDTGLTRIPVILGSWERRKGSYHGLALCTSVIPNQIFINRMFAMAMKNLMDTAFPKAVYDKNRISAWTNQVGGAIPVDLQLGENINNIASYLEPGMMSPQIIQMLNLAWDYTKETLGANDAMLGNVNPEQASGAAISVTAKQSAIPLTGPRDNMYDSLEELGLIFIDMIGAFYKLRPVVVDAEDGTIQVAMYDFERLSNVYAYPVVEVGATTPYDEIADRMTMESFLRDGHITFRQLLEAYPDIFPNADQVLKEVKELEEAQAMMPPLQEQPPMI